MNDIYSVDLACDKDESMVITYKMVDGEKLIVEGNICPPQFFLGDGFDCEV